MLHFFLSGEDTSLGTRALESCAYLAQSMLAHNFRNGPPMSPTEMDMFTGVDGPVSGGMPGIPDTQAGMKNNNLEFYF